MKLNFKISKNHVFLSLGLIALFLLLISSTDIFAHSPNLNDTTIEILFWFLFVPGILLIAYMIGWFIRILSKIMPKQKCPICSQVAADVLVIEGKTEGTYCRNHVMEKFSQGFLSFSYKMVVFHPEQDRKHCGTMYPYFPLDELVDQYNFEKEAEKRIKEILATISGKCQRCDEKDSQVAYYPKGILQWNESFGPLLENVPLTSHLLCKKCTLQFIEQSLRSNKENFSDNGLFVPYKGEGVYVNTYL